MESSGHKRLSLCIDVAPEGAMSQDGQMSRTGADGAQAAKRRRMQPQMESSGCKRLSIDVAPEGAMSQDGQMSQTGADGAQAAKRRRLEPLMQSGVFMSGDLTIGKEGMFINSPSTRPSSSRDSASSQQHSRPTFSANETRAPLPAASEPCSASERDGSSAVPPQAEVDFSDLSMDDLQNVCLVGHGSSGFVKKAIHKRTGLPLVVKVIHFDAQSELLRKQVTTELRTLYGSRHAHIVKYHQSFFDGGCITIVMEYMDAGSLAHVLQRHVATPLPEDMIAEIARQALEGLSYLHNELRVVHRDIKPSNMLVNSHGELKISDFGVSGQLSQSVSKCQSWVGTVTYMSPERIKGEDYSYTSDIWSIGLTLFECALGKFPYQPAQGQVLGFWDILEKIVETEAPSLPEGHSPEFEDFLGQCLRKDPTQRPSAKTLLQHPFIADRKGGPASLAEIALPMVFADANQPTPGSLESEGEQLLSSSSKPAAARGPLPLALPVAFAEATQPTPSSLECEGEQLLSSSSKSAAARGPATLALPMALADATQPSPSSLEGEQLLSSSSKPAAARGPSPLALPMAFADATQPTPGSVECEGEQLLSCGSKPAAARE